MTIKELAARFGVTASFVNRTCVACPPPGLVRRGAGKGAIHLTAAQALYAATRGPHDDS